MVIFLQSSGISRHELWNTGPNSVKVSENNNAMQNSSWDMHWWRLKLSNRHLNSYGLYERGLC